MICRLCLRDSLESFHIFENEGLDLKIAQIVATHFWFEPKNDDPISTNICKICWQKIAEFHDFYMAIEEAHRKLAERYSVKSEQCINIANELQNVARDEKKKFSERILYVTPGEEYFVDIVEDENDENEEYENPDSVVQSSVYVDVDYEDDEDHSNVDISRIDEKFVNNELTKAVEQTDEVQTEILNEEIKSTIIRRSSRNTANAKIKETEGESIKIERFDVSENCIEGKKKRKYTKRNAEEKAAHKTESEYLKRTREEDEIIAAFLKLKCEVCGQENFENFAQVKRHFQTVHSSRGYVTCCGRKLLKRVLLIDHIKRHINPEQFKCVDCKKCYADKQSLRNHLNLVHQSEERKIYQCESCPKRYSKQYLLEQHKIIHVPKQDRKYMCDMCNKGFASNNLLNSHIRYVHKNVYGKMCHICAKVIRGKTLFEKHQLEHKGIVGPKVQCKVCGAWLKHEYSLKKHIRRHEESEVDHVCSLCGKLAPTKGALRSHIKYVHEAERNFACGVCDKAFKKPAVLKEHMTTHTGERLYTCPHCPKTFNSGANMHSHRKKAHREEWEANRRYKPTPINEEMDQNKQNLGIPIG